MTTETSRTDAELLRRSKNDPEAFLEVCRRHAEKVAGFLASRLHDNTLEGELLAETLSEAWFARGRFRDPGDGNAGPWFVGIAHNLVRRTYRNREIDTRARAKLGLPVEPPDAYADLLDRMAAEHLVDSLGERLDFLPAEQREALELRVVDEL